MSDNTVIISPAMQVNEARKKRDREELEALMKEAGASEEPKKEIQEEAQEEVKEQPVVEETEEVAIEKPEKEDKTDWKKRYGDARRHMDELKKEIKELKEKTAEPTKLPATKEELEKMRKDHPDVARFIEAMAMEVAQKQGQASTQEIKEELKELQKERTFAKIRKTHADFDSLIDTEEFHTWAEAQPKVVSDMVYGTNPDDVIWAISQYKAANGLTQKEKTQKKKKEEIDAALDVRTPSKSAPEQDLTRKMWSESKVDTLTQAEYKKYAEEIDQAMRSGKFVYDLSK